MKDFKKETVINFLKKKGFSFKKESIMSLKRSDIIRKAVGNSTWGRVDYLINYCGFKFSIVED